MAHYTGDNLMTVHWLLGALVVPCDIGPDIHLNWVANTWKLRAVARSGSLAVFLMFLTASTCSGADVPLKKTSRNLQTLVVAVKWTQVREVKG